MCKCGARTYEQHSTSGKPAHAYKPDKVSQFIRR